jgi:hypothetical protein
MLKSQFDLHSALIEDQLALFGINAHQDLLAFRSRCQSKGLPFLTITLPQMGKDLERSIEEGKLLDELFVGFGRRGGREHDRRPSFLWGLWSLVFDTDGTLLANPDAKAIRAIRQITGFHGKLKELCSDERINLAYAQFVETDKQISEAPATRHDYQWFADVSHRIWGRAIGDVSSRIMHGEIIPKHGPGVVAEKLSSNGKYRDLSWTERLNMVFPIEEYVLPGYSFFEELDEFPLYSLEQELPSRVIPVPKTMEKPRIIAAEPSYLQKMQQGILTLMTERLGDHPVIGWIDQTRNREMARKASADRSLSTLDLSEASDRVSMRLVENLIKFNEYFLTAVVSARTQTAELPTGERILLKKFATMGSALCFPMEAMVFCTIIYMAIAKAHGEYLPSIKTLKGLEGKVSVYGDDIIVPREYTQSVIELLETFGLKVNRSKSFSESHFRESCGAEFYNWHDVSIVRARKRLPEDRQHVEELISIVAMRNLYAKAYGHTRFVEVLDDYIGGLIPFPYGFPETPALVRWAVLGTSQIDLSDPAYSFDYHLQRLNVKAVAVKFRKKDDPLEGYGALIKALTTPFQEDRDHLIRAGRPISARLKYGRYPLNG